MLTVTLFFCNIPCSLSLPTGGLLQGMQERKIREAHGDDQQNLKEDKCLPGGDT